MSGPRSSYSREGSSQVWSRGRQGTGHRGREAFGKLLLFLQTPSQMALPPRSLPGPSRTGSPVSLHKARCFPPPSHPHSLGLCGLPKPPAWLSGSGKPSAHAPTVPASVHTRVRAYAPSRPASASPRTLLGRPSFQDGAPPRASKPWAGDRSARSCPRSQTLARQAVRAWLLGAEPTRQFLKSSRARSGSLQPT